MRHRDPAGTSSPSDGLSRRRLLRALAALGVAAPASTLAAKRRARPPARRKPPAAAAPAEPAAPPVTEPPQPPAAVTAEAGGWPADGLVADVAIVGAGFAGIAAARRLGAAGKRVVLLEARDRIGGRTHTQTLANGIVVDIGGQWIGPGQTRCYELVRELGIELFPTFTAGDVVLEDANEVSTHRGDIPSLGLLSNVDLGLAMARLDALAATVDAERPWRTPGARRLDARTLASWIDANVHLGAARRLLTGALEMVLSADAARVSLLHTLVLVKGGVNLQTLFGVAGGAQQDRFVRGTVALAGGMLAPVESALRLDTPVQAVEQSADGVVVRTPRGRVRAARAIVALPPTLAGRIAYAPALAADRDQLTQTVPMGSVVKCMAVYPTPFWRAAGRNGQAVCTDGPIFATFDNSVPGRPEGILVGFAVASRAEALRRLPEAERRRIVVDALVRWFGPEAKSPSLYVDHAWAEEPWSRGCFLGFFPPGVWTTLGEALCRPAGRVHWAGTETARRWTGYIEGAIESGERAAGEVLAAS